MTFSLSLAEYIVKTCDPSMSVERITVDVGRQLEPGEESSTGLYAIMGHKGTILRVSLHRDIAAMLVDGEWRHIREARLVGP